MKEILLKMFDMNFFITWALATICLYMFYLAVDKLLDYFPKKFPIPKKRLKAQEYINKCPKLK